jgi:hypothetical protein
VNWGICSHHCEEAGFNTTMQEAKLSLIKVRIKGLNLLNKTLFFQRGTFILKESECEKLGKGMDIDTSTELCAALKNKDVIKYVVYRKKDKDKDKDEFEEYEKKEETVTKNNKLTVLLHKGFFSYFSWCFNIYASG